MCMMLGLVCTLKHQLPIDLAQDVSLGVQLVVLEVLEVVTVLCTVKTAQLVVMVFVVEE